MNDIKKTIEDLKVTVKLLYDDNIICSSTAKDFDLAIEALEKQLNGGWIPVSESLPEYDVNCLITTETGEVFTNKFYGYGEECQGFKEFPEGVWEINGYGETVIAWRPLPEKYKEVNE